MQSRKRGYTKRVNKYQQQGTDFSKYIQHVRDPEKRLWLSVIFQAFADLKKSLPDDKHSAHEFLSGRSGMLKLICSIVQWDEYAIMRHYRKEVASGV